MCQTTGSVSLEPCASQRITQVINREIDLTNQEIVISKAICASLNKKINLWLGKRLSIVFLFWLWRRFESIQCSQLALTEQLKCLNKLALSYGLGNTTDFAPQLLKLLKAIQACEIKSESRRYVVRYVPQWPYLYNKHPAPTYVDDLIEYVQSLDKSPSK